jgi:hypothetical protein
MTPEEEEQLREQARMQAMALRGQQYHAPEGTIQQADTLSGIGGALAGLGGRSVEAMSQDMVRRGESLRHLLALNKRPASAESNKGMWEALKSEYPELAANYQEGELSDAAAGKIYMQASANSRTRLAQKGANERVHYTQGETGKRFEKSYGLSSQRQAADLGAREAYGAAPLDAANPKPMSQEQATHLADMKAASDTVIEKTKQAKALYGKGGLILPGSNQAAQLNQLIVETYGPMLKTGNIGNLTDSHLHLLQSMLDNPGNWKNFVNDTRFPGLLDSLSKAAEENLEHQANSMGRTYAKPEGRRKHGDFKLDGPAKHPEGWDDAAESRLQELEAKLKAKAK